MQLDLGEKKAFRLHLIYSLLEGVILGIFTLNEFIFLTAMMGSNYLMGFIFTFSMGVFVFLIIFNEFIRRTVDKRKMLRRTALLTRLPMLLIIFFPTSAEAYTETSIVHFVFLGVFLIYYLGTVIIYPTTNLLLKNNYTHLRFGYLFSVATTAKNIIMLLSALAYGMFLDVYPYGFVYAYPFVGILGLGGLMLLSKISFLPSPELKIRKSFSGSLKESAKRLMSILKNNKPYFDFEIGFMLYGFAFMLSINVIHIYYVEVLELNNRSVAFYRNSYYILTIFMLPFFGKLIGRIDPRKFAALTFASMILYIFFLMLTGSFPAHIEIAGYKIFWMMMPYILFHAIFAATMGILWTIGSAYFCDKQDAGDYQAVHLFLTGIRGWIAPMFGIFFFDIFGFNATFSLTMMLLMIGIFVMFYSMKNSTTKSLY